MSADALRAHLQGGQTTVARCWAVTRRDGQVFGFTDHDQTLEFEGISFKADSGLTASALAQVTGLAVDNTEALGALSDASVTESDIAAGRFDGAQITAWLVNWADLDCRTVQFAGTIGELKRTDGAFQAELRGISEQLNLPKGNVFQKPCQAILGDARCKVDLDQPGYRTDLAVEASVEGRVFTFEALEGFDDRWFEKGRFDVLSGAAMGQVAVIKNDKITEDGRVIELWEELRLPTATGDLVRLEAGCDKRKDTCKLKFQNLLNFRGFPHIPGEDWLIAYPKRDGVNDGGSRYS